MQVKIQLNNPPATEAINVELQWNIKVTEPKSGWLPKLFRKHNRVNREVYVNITDIKISENVEYEKGKLFSILYKQERVEQKDFPVRVTLSDMTSPFQLLFHQTEIKDHKIPQDADPRIEPLTFKVKLIDPITEETIDYINERIDLIFDPLGVEPKFQLYLDEEKIQYSSALRKEKVGTIATWMEESFSFTPNYRANISCELYKGKENLSSYISLGKEEDSEQNIEEIKGGRENVIKTPVYIDFTNISNPINSEEDFTIKTTIVQSPSYSPHVKKTILKQSHFALKKDKQGTEIKMYVQTGNNEPQLYNMGSTAPSLSMNFVPKSRFRGKVSVIVKNIATDNSNKKAGLYIRNLTMTESIEGDARIIGENNSILNRFITIDQNTTVNKMISHTGCFIANGQNAQSNIDLYFNPNKILDVQNTTNYNFRIQTVLTFDYWEDKDGIGDLSPETKKVAKIPITWNLHLDPYPEWLCVDYGSSAIVCQYDTTILNLRKQKNNIFLRAENGDYRDDSLEKDTPFLSSDIVLHPIRETTASSLCSQQNDDQETPYLNLSVCLSPTSSLIIRDVRTQLPCLKILVGNELLPEKKDYYHFRYFRKDEKGEIKAVIAKDVQKEENCLLRVSSIFNEAYATLFKYFIQPQSKDKSINKLVLTYPNTYTPTHLKVLKNIALKTFPKVREGYLRFISESDAVAAYYLSNWSNYHSSTADFSTKETVLIYDMGAGTLDITLFKKEKQKYRVKEGTRIIVKEHIEVKILGKIGTGKAGNYLDYLISEIIAKKVPGTVRSKLTVSTESVPDAPTLVERLNLKTMVKENIKPHLDSTSQHTIEECTFNGSVILDDERFKEYLLEVTQEIINQLLSYIGDTNLHIDTVLMSGRSCRLQQLQDALKRYLKNHGCTNVMSIGKGDDKDKTVVVEGAKVLANNFSTPESPVKIFARRLYASYGIIYKVLGGRYRYTELLRSTELPFIYTTGNSNLENYDGPNVEIKGIAATEKIELIQTYLSPENTEEAYNKNNFEFISKMEEYNIAEFGNKDNLNVHLRLDSNNNVSIYVDALETMGNPPKGVDLTSEITKRSIWPVTI